MYYLLHKILYHHRKTTCCNSSYMAPSNTTHLGLGIIHGPQRICCLATLADKHAHIISEDRAAPVQQVTGQLQHHRHVTQLLHSLPGSQAGMEAGATCHKHHTPASPNGLSSLHQATQLHTLCPVGVAGLHAPPGDCRQQHLLELHGVYISAIPS
jgi:hypothetical protein